MSEFYEYRVPELLIKTIKEIQKVEGKEYDPRAVIEPSISRNLTEYLHQFLLTPQQAKYQKAIDYLTQYIIESWKAQTLERMRKELEKHEVRQVQKRD